LLTEEFDVLILPFGFYFHVYTSTVVRTSVAEIRRFI
jgi:hypothetical protein